MEQAESSEVNNSDPFFGVMLQMWAAAAGMVRRNRALEMRAEQTAVAEITLAACRTQAETMLKARCPDLLGGCCTLVDIGTG